MYKEAGEDLHDTIAFISQLHEEISKYNVDKEEGTLESHIKTIKYMKLNQLLISPTPGIGEHKKPVRLRDHYPEPNRQDPRKGQSLSLPQKQEGTRRECNP